jgi:glycosyltransferase involved in cell wall biosynthesis
MQQPLVSIIIPVKNSGALLEDCLESIKNQTYSNVEVIIVDSGSKDNTQALAKKFHARFYNYFPKVEKGLFDAPHKRNFGVKKAKGELIYYADADMRMSLDVIKDAVIASEKYDAIIIKEDSYGEGIWSRAKNLERKCYWGDNTVEAPRFVKKATWESLGGLDEVLGGGGDDWDLYQKLLENGYPVGRIKDIVKHYEGRLTLKKLFMKRFMYGRDSLRYIRKRPGMATLSYFPFRRSYLKNWKLFAARPMDACAFVAMRLVEYFGAFCGILQSISKK